MATKELLVVNSVLKNKDIGVLFSESVDDFFDAYKPVWEGIKNYYNKYHSIPAIEVIQERYPDLEEVSVKGDSSYYLEGLRNEFLQNRLERILLGASKELDDGTSPYILGRMQEELSRLNKYSSTAKDLNIMDFDDAERHYEEVRERSAAMGGTPGIPTGISFIDSAYTSGFAPGDLIIVMGWTGRAKSQFCTLLACNAHDKGFRPMVTSLEMSVEKVRDRIYTIKGSGLFKHSLLTLGDVRGDDFRTFKQRQQDRPEFLVIENDGLNEITPNIMQAKIDQHKPQILVFDYAQLGSDNENSGDMTARMRNMSKQYKRLAVANHIPIVLISSATADSSADVSVPPEVHQVAWSKQLSFDADLAFAVHKHDDSDIIEVVCRKNRNGALFSGYLEWDIDSGIINERFDLN